jgi:hypothetical protein
MEMVGDGDRGGRWRFVEIKQGKLKLNIVTLVPIYCHPVTIGNADQICHAYNLQITVLGYWLIINKMNLFGASHKWNIA